MLNKITKILKNGEAKLILLIVHNLEAYIWSTHFKNFDQRVLK